MLEVVDLEVTYRSGRDRLLAVDHISFAIPRGATLGLVGESGSGKSTIGRAIVGLLPISGGAIRLNGVDCTSLSARNATKYRRSVQMVFQDPFLSFSPRMTIGDAIADGVSRRGRPRAERRSEVLRLLDLVGLGPGTLERYPHEFSGGQRQRIAIARALAVEPEVIVLDEVTSALDVSVQANILNLLKDLQEALNLSFLFISHDLSVVATMSDEIAVMYLGQLSEIGPGEDLFGAPRHPYTQVLIGSVPRLESGTVEAPLAGDVPDPRIPPAGCRFHTRCPVGPTIYPDRKLCSDADPHVDAALRPHRAACHFASDEPVTIAPYRDTTQSP